MFKHSCGDNIAACRLTGKRGDQCDSRAVFTTLPETHCDISRAQTRHHRSGSGKNVGSRHLWSRLDAQESLDAVELPLELVPGEEHAHVAGHAVEPARSHDVDALLSSQVVV